MKIGFFWDGLKDPKQVALWSDGLSAALKILEKRGHTIQYDSAEGVDITLEWSSLLNTLTPDTGKPKVKCFAGGPINASLASGYDLYFVESSCDEEAFRNLGLNVRRAFGVNEELFKPKTIVKHFDAYLAAAYAYWKRHDLFAFSVKDTGVTSGVKQDHESECFKWCEGNGVLTLPAVPQEVVCELLNASRCAFNPADINGGGQRFTLEAMACNVPIIVMSDSKNAEYVKESGAGIICDPNPESVSAALQRIRNGEKFPNGRMYIEQKYTAEKYANSLEAGLTSLL